MLLPARIPHALSATTKFKMVLVMVRDFARHLNGGGRGLSGQAFLRSGVCALLGKRRKRLFQNAPAHALCLRQQRAGTVDLRTRGAGQAEPVGHAQREHHVHRIGLPADPRQAADAQPVQRE